MTVEGPELSFVFVATNERELLLQAIESIYDSGLRRSIEIMVVDNASTDGTAEEVVSTFPSVGLVSRGSRQGLAANLNEGIVETRAPYVVLCNSDVYFTPQSIDVLADFLDASPKAGMAAPALYSPEGEFRPSARRWYTWSAFIGLKGPWRIWASRTDAVRRSVYADWERGGPRRVDWVPCPATMVRREALDETGLLDERFPLYFNDVDISLRMHLAGWEVWCVPESAVIHLEQRASLSPLTAAWWSHLGSMATFWFKHRGLRPRPARIEYVEAEIGSRLPVEEPELLSAELETPEEVEDEPVEPVAPADAPESVKDQEIEKPDEDWDDDEDRPLTIADYKPLRTEDPE